MSEPLWKDPFNEFSKKSETKDEAPPARNSKGLLKIVKAERPSDLGLLERYKQTSNSRVSEESESNWLVSYADMMTLMVGFFILLQSFSKTDAAKFEQIKRSATKVFGGEYSVPFEKLSKKLKQLAKEQHVNNQVVFTESDDGVIVNFRGALFFESGSYSLKKEARDLIEKIIPVVGETTKDMGIIVEGYTDDAPTSPGAEYTNWELSSLRACAVLKVFESKGFNREKLRAQGFGDTHPVLPNEDDKGMPLLENRAQNRRVVIKILRVFE